MALPPRLGGREWQYVNIEFEKDRERQGELCRRLAFKAE